ncbi:MAG: FUSC family protein [Terracidiphilus sp.]
MATVLQSAPQRLRSFEWLWDFLREELSPYPGRGVLVARMVVAASIVVVVNMTFKIPFGAYGAVYALTISRENPEATVKAVKIILISYAVAVADVLIGALVFSGDPLVRLFWVAATLFLLFFALSASSNYTAAARFGYLVVITIPLWDQQVPAEVRVEGTLWAVGAITFASVITAAVELVFHNLKPWDDLIVSIAERLQRVKALLDSYIQGAPDKASEQQIQRLSMLGASRMRRDLQRSGYSPQYAEKMGAAVAYVGRLVDIAANLTFVTHNIPDEDRGRLRKLTEAIESIRNDLLNRRIPHEVDFSGNEGSSGTVPLLREMEVTVSLISQGFTDTQSLSAFAPSSAPAETRKGIFAPDAFSNPRHLRFGIRGGLAAFLCYVTYNLIAWPGISTAITTCLLTALTTIGSSRQKQILRFAGALIGGAIGMAAQVFILPSIDSIAGFLMLFVAVTIFAAWIATSGPRLSYFGVQVAVAFYLIHLQEFKFQTSLAVARDRVVGILLGLFAMWLIFDQLWGASAVVEMKRVFVSNIRLLAQYTRGPVSQDLRTAFEKSYSLRETINSSFDQFRQQADAVMLEFGSFRQRDLALRAQLLQWQVELRTYFIAGIALQKFRLRLRGFELPPPIQVAQKEFDHRLAAMLDAIADRFEGKAQMPSESFKSPLESLAACGESLDTCAKEL